MGRLRPDEPPCHTPINNRECPRVRGTKKPSRACHPDSATCVRLCARRQAHAELCSQFSCLHGFSSPPSVPVSSVGTNSLPARLRVTGCKVSHMLVDGRTLLTPVLPLRLAKHLEDWKPFHLFCRGLITAVRPCIEQ